MHVWTHDRWRFPPPESHNFPIEKYGLLRERMVAAGHEVHEAESVPWQWLEAVHDPELVRRIRTGGLSVREAGGAGPGTGAETRPRPGAGAADPHRGPERARGARARAAVVARARRAQPPL